MATGAATELGKIAGLLTRTPNEPTPLQRRLERVGRTLLLMCLGIVAVVAALGLVQGRPWTEVLIAAVSLAVAAVPEGLGAIVTIALAIGVQRMASRNVLVRQLPAVETLGSATVICTDKTGTLTTGAMTVRELWGPDHARLLDAAAACCNAELEPDGIRGNGDATEIAILAAAPRAASTAPPSRRRARASANCRSMPSASACRSSARTGRCTSRARSTCCCRSVSRGTEGAAAANLEMAGEASGSSASRWATADEEKRAAAAGARRPRRSAANGGHRSRPPGRSRPGSGPS